MITVIIETIRKLFRLDDDTVELVRIEEAAKRSRREEGAYPPIPFPNSRSTP